MFQNLRNFFLLVFLKDEVGRESSGVNEKE